MLYSAYRLGIFLTTHIPEKLAYGLAEIYARVWYLFDGKRKKIVRRHLQAIYNFQQKTLSPAEENRLTLNTFRNFSKYLFEVFRMPKMNKEYVERKIKVENEQEFASLHSEGKGAIMFSAHFCNWELGGISLSLQGYPMAAVALAHKDPHINQLFLSRREKFGLTIIDLDQFAARECLRLIHQGKILGLLGDEDYSEHSIEIDFLGEKMRVPRGPASLSRATGVPVFPCIPVRLPDNTFLFHFNKGIYPRRTDHQEEDIRQMTKQYLNTLAPYFLQYPDQWFRFRE